MSGYFISLEGPDGSGKTTISKMIYEYFKSKGVDIYLTREPGGSEIGEKIRDIILDVNHNELSDETEALLYAASRAQHVNQLIRPKLDDNKVVISDRYLMSSLAYQGVGRGLGIEEVKAINYFGTGGLEPDLILFFNIDPLETLRRKLGHEPDRLELEGIKFHERVYEGYLKAKELYKEKVVIIDASHTIEEVRDEAISVIEKNLKEEGLLWS